MGNSLGGRRRRAKVMKITGETFKLKTPATAADALRDHPGHVLLDSDAVKRFGVRADPIDPQQGLRSKKLYFLVELPKFPDTGATFKAHAPATRRVRSGINMSAKDRLECLMLSRRSVSDLPVVRRDKDESGGGAVRVKVRLPRAQMEKLMEESGDDMEVAEKILDLYIESSGGREAERGHAGMLTHRESHWKPGLDSVTESVVPKIKLYNNRNHTICDSIIMV